MADLLETLRTEASYLASKLTGAKTRARRAAFAAFDAAVAALGPGDLAIDLGANVGRYTEILAETGADVIAFEPDPHAFELLSTRVGGCPNVTLYPAAAGDQAGQISLYRRLDFDSAPDRKTSSSSIFGDKRKMDTGHPVAVELIDFPAFLAALERDVALIKIDIEGAEVPLMEALLAHPVAPRVAAIFLESHERVVRPLAARTRALKAQTAGLRRPQVNWDWH